MYKILVIEDEAPLLEELLDTLRFEGFDVIGANNGLNGLRMAREHLPDLIICDVMMPELNGYEVIQELRSDLATATIPFIFLTAKAKKEDLRKGMELGADDYLTKPFANADLMAAIRVRLAKQAATETQRLRAFSHQLIDLQENERHQVANRLQDEIGQIVTGLKLTLEMSKHLSTDAIRATLEETQDIVDKMSTKINDLALDLWPVALDHLGLLPALFWQFERYTGQTQIEVNFQHAGLERSFQPEIKTAIYRILQEGLANVAYHAGVDEVAVQIWVEENAFNIQVIDEGRGFELEKVLADAASIGLTGMNERAFSLNGELTIVTAPGEGTSVIVRIPIDSSVETVQPRLPKNPTHSISITQPIDYPLMPSSEPETKMGNEGKTTRPHPKQAGRKISIVLADGNDIMRSGLQSLLEAEPDFSVVGEIIHGSDAVDLVESIEPDILILDLAMAEIDSLDVTRHITQYFPQTSVLILSTYHEEAYFIEAFRGGASGYVLKSASADDLVQAVRETIAGRRYLSPSLSERAIESYIDIQRLQKSATLDAYGTLTNREREVLHLVLDGHINTQIAKQLIISPRTAETHRANMMRKLGLHNQTELIRFALRRGIISMND